MGVAGGADLPFWIVRGVARRMDVNVSDAMHEGRLGRVAFCAMLARCRVCQQAHHCLAGLADGAGAAPDCENARELARLCA